MTSVQSSLEGLACGACVGLLVTGVSSGHSCPVNNVAYSATYAREYQACVRILSRAGAVIGLGICCFIQNFVIMPGDLSLHIVHASITNFDGVSVANFVKRISWWEGLLQYFQELFSYIGFYIFVEGWVKLGDFSIFSFVFGGVISGIGVKFEFVGITTCL